MLSALLDVAIGLIVLYLVLSIAASAANESLSAVLRLRAKNLEYFFLSLFGEQGTHPNSLLRYLTESGTIGWLCLFLAFLCVVVGGVISTQNGFLLVLLLLAALGLTYIGLRIIRNPTNKPPYWTEAFYTSTLIGPQAEKDRRPAYVKASDFSQALLDMVWKISYEGKIPIITDDNKHDVETIGKLSKAKREKLIKSIDWNPPVQPANQPIDKTNPVKMVEMIQKFPTWVKSGDDNIANLTALKSVLSNAMQEAQKKAPMTLDELQKSLEKWYDGSQERVTGWYVRKVRLIVFWLGMGISLIFNVDTITITNSLLRNPALRQAVAAQANLTGTDLVNRYNAILQINQAGTAVANGTLAPIPTVAPTIQGSAPIITTPSAVDSVAFASTAQNALFEASSLDLPIGWPDKSEAVPNASTQTWAWVGWHMRKMIGLLITGLAVTQGAPFWFDLLNKVTNLRLSGKPPAKGESSPSTPATNTPGSVG